eukprot:CAMPEP_0117420264 /NCGR_PEP_ID=MMETSP0758-20121206/1630_1 /TAXON_ID=63605 /ORGANISM="Percolomonas cosmopolitus, Strain AE-1 (ATCC 50343)" /LENGTH=1154 /DNA_ID=CAMNT_0005201763 /DNA_START=555 /DNA_END=4016 /DNA_ORIENTATION=-
MIYLFHIERDRLVTQAQSSLPITKLSVNKAAPKQIATTGQDQVHIWHYVENELKCIDPLGPKSTQYTYTDHSWFDDEQLLVSTEEGVILIFHGTELKRVIGSSSHPIFPNHASIHTVLAVERGFLCAGELGYLGVFERTYDTNYYSIYKKFQCAAKDRFLTMCASKKEESIILGTEKNQLVHFNLSNVDIMRANEENFEMLPIGFHGDEVTGIDVCTQKSIVATVSVDGVLRIWDYLKREVILQKSFPGEQLYSVSLHPSGTNILIGFRYKLCLYNILTDDLFKLCEWFFKSCKIVRFSHGGHLFAAATTTAIIVIDSYNFQTVANLRGHTGMVKDLVWSENDLQLCSAGFEGVLYEWSIFPFESKDESQSGILKHKIRDNVEKSCNFSKCVYDSKRKIVAGIGQDSKIWQFSEDEIINIPLREKVTSMVYSNLSRTLFIGTRSGRILLYDWPLDDFHFREYEVHSSAITHLTLSFCQRYLFSVSSDGCCSMMDVESIVDQRTIHKPEFAFLDKFEDLVYTLRSTVDSHTSTINEYKEKLHQVKSESERKMNVLMDQNEVERLELDKKSQSETEKLKHTIEVLKHQMAENEAVHKQELKELKAKHHEDTIEVQELFKKTVEKDQQKFRNMVWEKDNEISEKLDELKEIREIHEKELQGLRMEYAKDKMSQVRSFNELGSQYNDMQQSHSEEINQFKNEQKSQIDDLQNRLLEQDKREKRANQRARTKAALNKTELDGLRKIIKGDKTRIKDLNGQVEQLQRGVEQHKKERVQLEEQLIEHRETITNHEKSITELKKQCKELEKLRYVLTYKFTRLKDDVTPKEDMIHFMNDKLTGMDKELDKIGKDKMGLLQMISNQKQQLKAQQKQIKENNRNITEKNRKFKLLLDKLGNMAQNCHNPKMLNKFVVNLVEDQLDELKRAGGLIQRDPEKEANEKKQLAEFSRQRDYLQQQINGMKRTLEKKEKNLRKDVTRRVGENASLVAEINKLRREVRDQKSTISQLQFKLRTMTKQMNVMQSSGGHPSAVESPPPIHSPATRPSTSGMKSRRRSTGASSHGLNRVRTPDSFFSTPRSRRSSRRKSGGRIVRGSTVSRLSSSSSGADIHDVIRKQDKTNKLYAEQQAEMDRLKDYVSTLSENMSSTNQPDPVQIPHSGRR